MNIYLLQPEQAIKAVYESLESLKARWQEVGKALSIPQSKLEEARQTYEGSYEKCLKKVAETWLASPNPSWRQLAAAIASVDKSVANSIADKHPLGNIE